MVTEEEAAAAIKKLPRRLLRPFVMRYLQRKTLAEIAGALHISARRVDRRLTKATEICRARTEGDERR